MTFRQNFLVAIILLFTNTVQFGQRIENSPYSRLGLGDKVDAPNVMVRGMGGLSTAIIDPYHFNLNNPASLPYLYATTYEIGMHIKNSTITDKNSSSTAFSGNLDYINLAFPLSNPINEAYEGVVKKHKFALGLSLNRVYHVAYNIQSQDSLGSVGTVQRNYTGQGGTYKFALSGGYKYKNFSVGTSLGYYFGNTEYRRTTDFLSVLYPYNNDFTQKYFLRGFGINTGAIYTINLNSKAVKENNSTLPKRLVVGATFNSGVPFSTVSNIRNFSLQTFSTSASLVDTIRIENGVEGKGNIPNNFSFSLFYQQEEQFGLGFEIGASPWSKYENEANYEKINTLGNTFNVSFGGFIRPDYKSYTNYFKRVQYRYGAYYQKDPRIVGNQQINNVGITGGLGLPFVYQRKVSHVNLSFDIGRTGSGTALSETYFKIGGGFNFNDDEWFLKRKYK